MSKSKVACGDVMAKSEVCFELYRKGKVRPAPRGTQLTGSE
jgi:hypothetical protein